MNIGMLWLIDNPALPLVENIQKAAEYYHLKYGGEPDACYVNQNALVPGMEIPGIALRPQKNILPRHLWIGVEDG